MKSFFSNPNHKNLLVSVVVALVLSSGAVAFGEYRRGPVVERLSEDKKELVEINEQLTNKIGVLEGDLSSVKTQVVGLIDVLGTEQNKSDAFEEKLGKVADTIGTLDSLSKTDPQLLEKYSKVYFLNEHYVPKELVAIDPLYIYESGRVLQIHAQVWPYLSKLLADANDELELKVASAYRSFSTQASLKSNYKVTYGAGTANSFSADQGYSEHQLGTTVDFTTPAIGGGLSGFEKSKESDWLLQNAYKYGFILSYPEGNKYYIYEPWHWRFVGVDLAEKLHRDGKYFYDMDQREINTYLSVIFN